MGYNWKTGLSGAAAGAASGAAAGPWGAAIGAGVGLLGGLNDVSAPATYRPDPSLFSYGGYEIDGNGVLHQKGFGNAVPTYALEQGAAQYSGVNPYIGSARGTQAESRAALLASLGEGASAADATAAAQASAIGQRARSMLASGPYSPAAARNAINWQAGAAQQLLPQQLAARLQEAEQIRQARLNALLSTRAQDISQLGQEMGLESSRHGYALGLENAATPRYAMEQQDRQFAAQLAADYARLQAQQNNQEGNWQYGANQANATQQNNMMLGAMGATSGGLQSWLLDKGKSQQEGGSGNDLIDPWRKP